MRKISCVDCSVHTFVFGIPGVEYLYHGVRIGHVFQLSGRKVRVAFCQDVGIQFRTKLRLNLGVFRKLPKAQSQLRGRQEIENNRAGHRLRFIHFLRLSRDQQTQAFCGMRSERSTTQSE